MIEPIRSAWGVVVLAILNLFLIFGVHYIRVPLAGRRGRRGYVVLIGMMCIFLVEIVGVLSKDQVHLRDLTGAVIIYGGLLFVLLSEAMFAGLAMLLTTWRGENWVKEIDYVYLILGAIGLALSINHLHTVDDPISIPEYIGPFIVVTALVVRAIKTRAEINGWNKHCIAKSL